MASNQSPAVSSTAKNVPKPMTRLYPVNLLQLGQKIISMTGYRRARKTSEYSTPIKGRYQHDDFSSCDAGGVKTDEGRNSTDPVCLWIGKCLF